MQREKVKAAVRFVPAVHRLGDQTERLSAGRGFRPSRIAIALVLMTTRRSGRSWGWIVGYVGWRIDKIFTSILLRTQDSFTGQGVPNRKYVLTERARTGFRCRAFPRPESARGAQASWGAREITELNWAWLVVKNEIRDGFGVLQWVKPYSSGNSHSPPFGSRDK